MDLASCPPFGWVQDKTHEQIWQKDGIKAPGHSCVREPRFPRLDRAVRELPLFCVFGPLRVNRHVLYCYPILQPILSTLGLIISQMRTFCLTILNALLGLCVSLRGACSSSWAGSLSWRVLFEPSEQTAPTNDARWPLFFFSRTRMEPVSSQCQ